MSAHETEYPGKTIPLHEVRIAGDHHGGRYTPGGKKTDRPHAGAERTTGAVINGKPVNKF